MKLDLTTWTWQDNPGCPINITLVSTSDASEATVQLAKKTPQDLYYECLDEGEAWQFTTPNLLYKIDMQARYDAARATVLQYTLQVPIPKETSSQIRDSEEESHGPSPSPKKTDATEMKIDESLQVCIEALHHLEPLHYGFKLQALNVKGYCFCPLAKCLTPWRKNHHVVHDHSVCRARHFQGPGLLQHCHKTGDEYHTATTYYLTTLFDNGIGLTQAAVHHVENDQSRKTIDANKQIFDCYYQSVDSKESDHLNQVNENIVDKACDTVRDLAICDHVEKNDAFTSIEQEFQGDIGVSDYNTSSDEQIIAENQAKDVQAEQELPGQRTHHNEIVNSVGEATDGNDDPSKDPDHMIDAENTIVDEPDCTLDSVEINIVGDANDTNGHPCQESDVTVNAKNSNVDEPDIIYDRSKTIDTIAEQTESMVDDDFEHNDVSKKRIVGVI